MVGVAVPPPPEIPGPDQLNDTGELDEEAEIVGELQVTVCAAVAETFGGVPLAAMV